MSAIDHKAEAEKIEAKTLANIDAAVGQGAVFSPDAAASISTAFARDIALAQLHATLFAAEQTAELVKQQRIANLIAVWTVSEGDAEALMRNGVNFGGVLTEIRDGLGLS